jgi:hypothetical protein
MQMKKAGVVATGALATVAIMGAPAAAAPSTDASALTKASTSTEGKYGKMRQVGANQLKIARGGGWDHGGNGGDNLGWDAPWDIDPQAVTAEGNGTVLNTLPYQGCGSTAAFTAGVSTPITTPNTLLANLDFAGFGARGGYDHQDKVACANGNIKVTQWDEVPLTAIGNHTVVSTGSSQACGSTAGFIGGIATATTSPNTVFGDCQNGNIEIVDEDRLDNDGWEESTRTEGQALAQAKARMALVKKVGALKDRKMWAGRQAAARVAPQARSGGWDAPWDIEPFGILATANGTSIATDTNQACGSTAVLTAGAATAITSPNTLLGDCKNANVKIDQKDPSAATYALNNTSINTASLQACGSTMAAIAGAAVATVSSNTVIGSCYNANILID